ncbi:hypothetical protein [Flavobacterium sp. H4147]|uniref:hypothetical protein n=1 Tax=Flavobacterium sp. H4147 TaxID=3034149 RepID=UPI0023EAE94E|nr:hypothetical protein [Flavobacterium sp. H4147]
MKTLLKTRIVILLFASTALFSCKKNENNTVDANKKDTLDMSVDTIGPSIDSSATLDPEQHGKYGTTGATGEGSTGSGTDGSLQKGNQNIKTDSIKK